MIVCPSRSSMPTHLLHPVATIVSQQWLTHSLWRCTQKNTPQHPELPPQRLLSQLRGPACSCRFGRWVRSPVSGAFLLTTHVLQAACPPHLPPSSALL